MQPNNFGCLKNLGHKYELKIMICVSGMNALVVYVGHMLCYNVFPFHWSYGPMNKHYILMLETLWGALLWILISFWLYKKKVFISL